LLVRRRVDALTWRATPVGTADEVANALAADATSARWTGSFRIYARLERCPFEKVAGINCAGVAVITLHGENAATLYRIVPACSPAGRSVDLADVGGARVVVGALDVVAAAPRNGRRNAGGIGSALGLEALVNRAWVAVIALAGIGAAPVERLVDAESGHRHTNGVDADLNNARAAGAGIVIVAVFVDCAAVFDWRVRAGA
jgi:hypothetical protein